MMSEHCLEVLGGASFSSVLASWVCPHRLNGQMPASHPDQQVPGLLLGREDYLPSPSRRSSAYLDFESIRAITPPSVEGLRQSLPKTHGLAGVPTTERFLKRANNGFKTGVSAFQQPWSA